MDAAERIFRIFAATVITLVVLLIEVSLYIRIIGSVFLSAYTTDTRDNVVAYFALSMAAIVGIVAICAEWMALMQVDTTPERWKTMAWIGGIALCLFILCIVPYGRPKPFDAIYAHASALARYADRASWRGDSRIELPADWANVSSTGDVYVTHEDGKAVLFVPAWLGRDTLLPVTDAHYDDWIDGYVYVKGKLPAGQHIKVASAEPADFWQVDRTKVTEIKVLAVDDLGDGWHHVVQRQ